MGLRTNHEVIGVVENMAYFECRYSSEKTYLFGRGGGERVANGLRTQLISQIPMATLEGSPLFSTGTPQWSAFEGLAQEVMERRG